MVLNYRSIRIAAVALAATLALSPLHAQEISESHLAAAREAASIAQTFKRFDEVLPLLSRQVQDRLIRMRPDLYQQISQAVESVALKLAAQRAELDAAVARVWAENFTEEELKAITAFYQSPAGQKFIASGPRVVSEGMEQVKAWSDKVGEELFQGSREELKKQGIEF